MEVDAVELTSLADKAEKVLVERYDGFSNTYIVLDRCARSANLADFDIYIGYTIYSVYRGEDLSGRFWNLSNLMKRAFGKNWAGYYPRLFPTYKPLHEMPEDMMAEKGLTIEQCHELERVILKRIY